MEEEKSTKWLDKAKKKLMIESDYELAKVIGIKPSAISNIKKKKLRNG